MLPARVRSVSESTMRSCAGASLGRYIPTVFGITFLLETFSDGFCLFLKFAVFRAIFPYLLKLSIWYVLFPSLIVSTGEIYVTISIDVFKNSWTS